MNERLQETEEQLQQSLDNARNLQSALAEAVLDHSRGRLSSGDDHTDQERKLRSAESRLSTEKKTNAQLQAEVELLRHQSEEAQQVGLFNPRVRSSRSSSFAVPNSRKYTCVFYFNWSVCDALREC